MENIELTQQTADQLSAILNENPEQAKEWLTLEPDKAVSKINALGHNFTSKELKAYGQSIRATVQTDLKDSELDGVSGGVDRSQLTRPAPIPIVALPGIINPVTPIPNNPIGIRPLPIELINW